MNVYPEDVENALLDEPGVTDAVVLGREHEGDVALHAVLLLQPGADAEAIVRRANKRLAPHQRVKGPTVWPEVHLSGLTATLTCVDMVLPSGLSGLSAPRRALHLPGLSSQRSALNLPGVMRLSGPSYDNGCTQAAHNIIHLYADANETGDSLCVYGNSVGWLNLYNVPHGFDGIYGTWNDIASCYLINGSTCWGTFAVNGNGGGTTYFFFAPEVNNFDGIGGRLPNDSLSSVGATTGC
jgi:AMP-binding enzyme C-terminal domain